MGPRRVIEGHAAEVKRRERWEAAVKRRRSRRRNVGLLAAIKLGNVDFYIKPKIHSKGEITC